MPPHDLVDFVVLPPGHGRSVTDFWGWDAHKAQLRCPADMSCDIGGCSARRALKPKFYQPTQTVVTAGILPFRENSHGRAGNRTRDLMISSQRLWPLDHEAGQIRNVSTTKFEVFTALPFRWLQGLKNIPAHQCLESRHLIFAVPTGTRTCFVLWQWYTRKTFRNALL